MRIGIVSHHGGTPAGAEQTLLLFLNKLPADVTPVFFNFEEGEFTEYLRARYGSVMVVQMSERVAKSTRAALRFDAVGDALDLARRLAMLFRKNRIDVVLTNTMKAHVIGSVAARIVGIPCINYLHDVLAGLSLQLVRAISRFFSIERFACSAAVAENLAVGRTTVIYPGIVLSDYEELPDRSKARRLLGIPDDGLPVVGLVGRIIRWKGQDRFLRIAASVLKDTDAHFAIIGGPVFACEPEFPGELERFVAEQGLGARVHFPGWQNDIQSVYAAMDISCNCSTQEPFGRTTLEAFAAGVPVVCFDDAGVCEIFESNRGGVKIPAGNEALFAAAVGEYLREPARLALARSDALAVAKQLSMDGLAQRFVEVIERVSTKRSVRFGVSLPLAAMPMSGRS